MKKFTNFTFLALVMLTCLSCPPGTANISGGLRLHFTQQFSRIIQAEVDLRASYYFATLTHELSGETWTYKSEQDTLDITGLVCGTWRIEVSGYHQDTTLILEGWNTAEVIAEEINDVTIPVIPLAGKGELDITIKWDSPLYNEVKILASLTPYTDSDICLHDAIDVTGSLRIVKNELPVGEYLLSLLLLDSEQTILSGALELVRIFNDETSSGEFLFSECNNLLAVLSGQESLKFSLEGLKSVMDDQEELILLPRVPAGTGNVVCILNVDDKNISIGRNCRLGGLSLGMHTVTVSVYSVSGEHWGTLSAELEVADLDLTPTPTPTITPTPTPTPTPRPVHSLFIYRIGVGKIKLNGQLVNNGEYILEEGKNIELTASPGNCGNSFLSWNGSRTSQDATLIFTLDTNISLTAIFSDCPLLVPGECGPAVDCADCYDFIYTEELNSPCQWPLSVGDIDGDGEPELVSGSGIAIVLGDLDNDDDLDRVIVNWGSASVIELNDGSGRFTQIQTLGGNLHSYAAIADINGDTYNDVILGRGCSGNCGGYSRVLMNTGDGHCEETQQIFANNSRDIVMLDINNDNFVDYIPARGNIHLNNGTGFFEDSGSPLASDLEYIESGDLDNDGDLDIIATDWDGIVYIFENSYGGLSLKDTIDTGIRDVDNILLGDMDNDCDLDFYLQTWNMDSYRKPALYIQQQSGIFIKHQFDPVGDSELYYDTRGAVLMDVNKDNALDIIMNTRMFNETNYQEANIVFLNNLGWLNP